MLLAELSIWPMDKGVSVAPYVARALDVIDKSGLAYKVGPLGTCIEGDYDAVMAVVKQCHEALWADSDRVMCSLKMDWRRGKTGRIDGKVDSVEKSLGRSLNR
ncbi:MTH1187 family thiamine-binding protein [bacterium]|nr:MAG: MTH1187 family thiamine-binding protein [bacterium]